MNYTYRVPWPVIRLPFGHMAEHPLRLQLTNKTMKDQRIVFRISGRQTLSREQFYRI